MESTTEQLSYVRTGSSPIAWPGDPKLAIDPPNFVPVLPQSTAVYVPRDTVTLEPVIDPRQHLQQTPTYDPRDHLRVQPTLKPGQTYTAPNKIAPPKTLHEQPREAPEPWALLPESDLPATPQQLGSTAKSQSTLPGETHAVAGTKERSVKTMLDLFV